MYPGDGEGFEWDEANEAELARIEPWEVEEVFLNGPKWARNRAEGSGDWKMVGRTNAGRALTVVVSAYGTTRWLRAITGWTPTRGERTKYLDRP